MKLALVKSLWGVPASGAPSAWDEMFAKISSDGFAAVETIALVWGQDAELFKSLLKRHGICISYILL